MLPPAESIQIVLLIPSVLFLFLSFRNSTYGVIAYLIIMTAKLGDMYPALGAIRFELLAAVVVFVSIFLGGGDFTRALPKQSPLNKSLWILFAVGMLSVIQSVDVSVSWNAGGYNFLKMVLFYVMVVSSVRDDTDLSFLLWTFVLLTAWIAYEPVTNFLRGNVQTYGYGDIAYGRFGAATGHVALANTLSQAIPLTYFLARSEEGRLKKVLLWVLLGLIVFGVIVTKSRGGFLGICAAGAAIAFLSERRLRAFAVLAMLLVLLLPFAGEEYTARIETIEEGVFASRSTSDRYLGLVNGVSMMIKRPLLGVGIGAYAEARQIFFNYYFYAHNLYGELFGELGLASAAWFWWVFLMFRTAQRLKREHGDFAETTLHVNVLSGVQAGLFVRLVLGNFSHCAFIWFWFLMAAFTVRLEHLLETRVRARDAASPEMVAYPPRR